MESFDICEKLVKVVVDACERDVLDYFELEVNEFSHADNVRAGLYIWYV